MQTISRRQFVHRTALASAALAAPAAVNAAGEGDKISLAFIGPGGMGTNHIKTMCQRKDVIFSWVCDVDSKRAEAAAKLVSFFLSDPDATAILGGERGIPASSEVRERLRPKMSADDQVMLDYISNLGDHAGSLPPPAPAGGGEIDELLAKAAESVAFGAQSPADGAKTYIEDAKAVLARSS